jgi:hypothetical protein
VLVIGTCGGTLILRVGLTVRTGAERALYFGKSSAQADSPGCWVRSEAVKVLGQFVPRVKLHWGDAEVHGRQLASDGQGLMRAEPPQPMRDRSGISHAHPGGREATQEISQGQSPWWWQPKDIRPARTVESQRASSGLTRQMGSQHPGQTLPCLANLQNRCATTFVLPITDVEEHIKRHYIDLQ